MRFLRSRLIPLFFATSVALASPVFAGFEDGCILNLQSDLKRQDLAAAIGLHYYRSGERPAGITRKVQGGEVYYFAPSGERVLDPATLERVNALKIPPAYTDVWISPDAESHVLAIGFDSRHRPQYAYHPLWTDATSVTKFVRMEHFGKKIADVRQTMKADILTPGLGRRKLLATVALVLETGSIRVGSVKYAVENGSYGLTTLLHSHVQVSGSVVAFDFIGKEGIRHVFEIDNPLVAPVFADLLRQPTETLFAGIDAEDVKKYLQEISGGEKITAKDFRTWEGTTAAAKKLLELGAPKDLSDAEAKIKIAVEYAASLLRNEPGTARENYIHALVLTSYAEGRPFQDVATWVGQSTGTAGLAPEERFVLELIRRSRN
jgi:DNA topoisomerase-1